MAENLEQTGLDAVNRFLDTFNSRDKEKWADSLNFPHVRPSPFGPINIATTRDEYISRVDYDRLTETGWDHSEWDYTKVIHLSDNKIHVAGQWSRYDADGNKILTTPIVYIVTRSEGNWGIQSRFGSDHAGEDDTSGMETRAINLFESFVANYSSNRPDVCRDLMNFPHFQVEPGQLNETTTSEDFKTSGNRIEINTLMVLQAGNHSINVASDISVTSENQKRDLQAVVNITNRDDHLGIQAWSILDPQQAED